MNKMRWEEVLNAWLLGKNFKESTRKAYKGAVREAFEEIMGIEHIEDVTLEKFNAYAAILERYAHPPTAKKKLGKTRLFLQYCYDEGLTSLGPEEINSLKLRAKPAFDIEQMFEIIAL